MDEMNYGAWMVDTIFAKESVKTILQNKTKGAATPDSEEGRNNQLTNEHSESRGE